MEKILTTLEIKHPTLQNNILTFDFTDGVNAMIKHLRETLSKNMLYTNKHLHRLYKDYLIEMSIIHIDIISIKVYKKQQLDNIILNLNIPNTQKQERITLNNFYLIANLSKSNKGLISISFNNVSIRMDNLKEYFLLTLHSGRYNK